MTRGLISLLALAFAMLLFVSSPLRVYANEPNELSDLPPDKSSDTGELSDTPPDKSGGTGELSKTPDKSSDMGGEQEKPPAPVTTGETQGSSEAYSYTPPSPPPDPDIVKPSRKNDRQMEQNRGSIEDNRGTIKENFGTIAYNGGTVERHFWSMNTVMSPGDYSISYGDGFRVEKDADGKLRLFLESGTDGIVTILPPDGKVVTKVVFMVNGDGCGSQEIC
ncbi:MAG: hypothetical protein IJP92_13225 [Lachnospiraceae bacterium]|nr:hypothetical protein [Lachnospiraceae bacterium]